MQNVSGLEAEKPKTLIVTGVQNQSGAVEWDDQLVALGVNNLIAEAFFQTGEYIPVETNPEVINRIKDFHSNSQQYHMEVNQRSSCPAQEKTHRMESDAIAYGIVQRFDKQRKRAMAGPFSFSKVTASLEIEIFIKESGKQIRSAIGKGEGVTLSKGLLVQIRKGAIRFDETSIGIAARDAIHQAVIKLMSTE